MTTVDEWAAAGEMISVGDERIFFRRGGVGPTLLLLHAYPSASWGFHKVWDGLTARFDVIAPDLPGSGLSQKRPDRDYGVPSLADAVEAFAAAIGVRAADMLCHAYASTVGQELLARQREGRGAIAFRSAVFVNAGLFPEVGRKTMMQKLLLSPLGPLLTRTFPAPYAAFQKRIGAQFGPATQPTEAEFQAIWRLLTLENGAALVPKTLGYLRDRVTYRDRYVGALIEAPAPVALLCAPGDAISGTNVIDRWRELCPARPLRVLPAGVGHYPPLECPDAVLTAFDEVRAEMGIEAASADEARG